METNEITEAIIGAAIKVHRRLGPGLFEAVYERCLAYELRRTGLRIEQQKVVPLHYDGINFESAYRLDLIVEDLVIVEIKAVENILPLHKAQTLSYLRLLDVQVGLLINFNVACLKNGITRIVNNFQGD